MSLLFAGLHLLSGPQPVNAAQLKDVRIGEYDGFTRIVFEIDNSSAHPQIEILPGGKLRVGFDQTDVNLVRKIPVERSQHIKGIQFWQRNDALSTVLLVDFPYFRFETFPLSSPPRIAVDIFPVASPPNKGDTSPNTVNTSAQTEPETPLEEDASMQLFEQEKAQPPKPQERLDPQPADGKDRAPSETAVKEAKQPIPKLRASDPEKESSVPPSRSTRQTAFRLQFFLVIGLVVITIGILFLLLMMLFARHRFSEVKDKLSTSDFLQQQDKKIEALNSRIKEQFNRYDKAANRNEG